MTESPPVEAAEAEPKAAAEVAAEGLYTWLSTSDHKVIGRIWIRLSLLLLVAATALGAAVAVEQANGSDELFGGLNAYFQMWGLSRFGLVLMVAVPLFIGLATIVVPMQVGSSNIAFPRAAAAAAWGYVFGSVITIVSVIAGGGWGALDGVSGEEADAIELTLLGTGLLIASILLASVCIVTTVISLRTPGMGLAKVPLFAWSMLVAGTVWLLTLPIALANLIVITVDLRGGPLLFGNPEPTGSSATLIYDQLAWILEQPQVYAIAIPVLGVIGSIIPVVAKGRHASHAGAMVLIGLAGLLAAGGWSQPHFGDHRDEFVYIAFGLVFIVPILATLAVSGLTLLQGEAPVGIPPAHLLGALGSGLLLVLAAAVGALRVIDPLDLIGTTADTAVLSLTAFAAITGGIAGLWFWAPKIGGRQLSAPLGSLAITALIGAGVLTGLGALVAGFDDTPDIVGGDLDGLAGSMLWIMVAGLVIGTLGALDVLGAIALSVRSDVDAGDDPWDGHTLEWSTPTPVPVDNFSTPPARVTSEAPLLDTPAADEGEDS
ncbi:MAG: cbb3-type cytochrome c oxidase subunit I [Actinomycetota bacterium]